MRLLRLATGLLLVVAMQPGALLAQDGDNPVLIPTDNTAFGASSAEFLQMGSSARGMALGGAYATLATGVDAVYYNAAGLPLGEGAEATFTLMPYFADTDYYWAGLAFPFGGGDFGFGAFLGRFGFGNQPVYTEADPEGLSGETYGVNEVVAGLSFAHAFIDRFSAGLTIKYINDDLATGALGGASASTLAVDLGTNFHSELFDRPLSLSFVVQNLGGDLSHSGNALQFREFDPRPGESDQRLDPPVSELQASGFPLPRAFRVGAAFDPISNETIRLSVLAEYVDANNQAPGAGFGLEFAWTSTEAPIGASLRGSYQLQPDNRNLDAAYEASDTSLDGMNVGGGLFYRIADRYRAQFDYTYRHFGALGSVDAFSFTIAFE